MSSEGLTKEQIAFLEECNLEFSERFTDSDVEYKKTYDTGIPPPPIVFPWHVRGRFNNRDRPGSSRYNDHYRNRNSDYRHEDNYRDREYRHRDRYRPY